MSEVPLYWVCATEGRFTKGLPEIEGLGVRALSQELRSANSGWCEVLEFVACRESGRCEVLYSVRSTNQNQVCSFICGT